MIFAAALLAGCSKTTVTPSASAPPASTPSIPAETPTALLPTPTFEPMAAWVNGAGIPAVELADEIGRFQAAQTTLGRTVSPEEARKQVLDGLIDRSLLVQAAEKGGFTLDEAGLQQRIDQVAAQAGGMDKLEAWEKEHGYTPDTFRKAVRQEAAAAWQRDQIIKAVPTTAEQVHARQILVDSEESARQIQARLQAGVDFATLALSYDPVAGGDLGWFPQGYLSEPEVEAAAFALQPGQVSEIIQGKLGYHVIQVIERDPQHSLSPDALLMKQKQALQQWLRDQRANSKIDLVTP